MDENSSNGSPENLAVLCLECHTETQVRGGFHRKLDSEQVLLYRNDWLRVVGRERATARTSEMDERMGDQADIELATSVAEIYRESQAYDLLAMHYNKLDNKELRDKYIELAIKAGLDDSSIIYFRAVQGRQDLIPGYLIAREESRLKKKKDYFELARFYRDFKRPLEAVVATCQGAAESIKKGNTFTAAFYLKEMSVEGDVTRLFELSYEKSKKGKDLWWQLRALREMDMHSEADELVKANKSDIQRVGYLPLLLELALVEKNEKLYVELSKQEAREESESSKKATARSKK